MADITLGHYDLGSVSPWNPNITDHYTLDVDIVSGRLLFLYGGVRTFADQQVSRKGRVGAVAAVPPNTKLLDIHITDNCWIDITLSQSNIVWHWHNTRAITTGLPRPLLYFNLQYYVNGNWQATSQGLQCERIRFGAVYRAGLPVEPVPFNLNVSLEYSNTEYLAVTVDPDIQNPGTNTLVVV